MFGKPTLNWQVHGHIAGGVHPSAQGTLILNAYSDIVLRQTTPRRLVKFEP